jgi:hypothetical protein
VTDVQKIARYFGYERQEKKLLEELSELSCALYHDSFINILEELADVELMLEQVIYLLGKQEEIERIKSYKVNRTLRMIGEKEHVG